MSLNLNAFVGTGALVRLAIRRDRIQLPVWLLGLTGVTAATAASITDLYGSQESRINYARTSAASVVARAFNGPTSGPDPGAITMVETFSTVGVLAALMSIFAVVRHTRQNEETGRAELLGAGVVGRYAGLTAAVLVTVTANLVLGVLIYAVLAGSGLAAGGSALMAAALALSGCAFVGVAAVTAQIAQTARAANGVAAAVLGLSYLARAAGDAFGSVTADGMAVVSAWPSWLSPLGWAQQIRPFRDDNWILLALPAALFVTLLAIAFVMIAHRDVGTGMLPVRAGPPTASRRLLSPLGLAWRLQRGALIGWAVAIGVVGLAFGAVANEIDDMVGGNPEMRELMERLGGSENLVTGYFSAVLGICAIAAAGYAAQALLRMRAEEAGGPLESVLATAVSRPRWMASHIAVAGAGTAALLVLAGATGGLAYGLTAGDVAGEVSRTIGAALVRLPASLVLAGFVVAVFGLVPRYAVALSWTALVACLLLVQVGALLDLPQAVLNASPFTHVPAVPAVEATAAPLVALTGVALALVAVGMTAFRRRDLTM